MSQNMKNMASNEHDKDLPLLSNTHEILVWHYILDLKCDLDAKVLHGSITLFLTPTPDGAKRVFSIQDYMHRLAENRYESLKNAALWKRSCVNCVKNVESKCESIHRDIANNVNKSTCAEPANNKARDYKNVKANCLFINEPSKFVEENLERREYEKGANSPAACVSKKTEKELLLSSTSSTCIAMDPLLCSSSLLQSPHSQPGDDCRESLLREPGHTRPAQQPFHVILDCCSIHVSSVEELLLSCEQYHKLALLMEQKGNIQEGQFSDLLSGGTKELQFSVEEWCIRIWKENLGSPSGFPPVVRISYSTVPQGASLRWTKDQDGNPCMFSAAMWINNRSMFPCQEFGSLSTWQAYITVPEGATVLMSGDEQEKVVKAANGQKTVYYKCSSPLPSFTLAIAVGYWECTSLTDAVDKNTMMADHMTNLESPCHHSPSCQVSFSRSHQIATRVWAAKSLLQKTDTEFRAYMPRCLSSVVRLLGPFPFQRADFLIYPPCSQDMAMANPSLIFLSQSLLGTDGSMCIRLGHELSHWWFGLLMGAKDWTEEWLSEGFATYVEDVIHADACGWTDDEFRHHSEIRAMIRHRTLRAELDNTAEHIQTLRPNQGREVEDSDSSVMYVKNGMNPEKLFTQVHYLKGYFLLRHLASLIGNNNMNNIIKKHIEKHHGELIYSKDFLRLIFETFPTISNCGTTLERLYEEWLDCPGMPKGLMKFAPSADNQLHTGITEELSRWKKQIKRRKHQRKRRKVDTTSAKLSSDMLVLLLEYLLELPAIPASQLTQLNKAYNLSSSNADIRHRWCELVVKHKFKPHYSDVASFLINDQAMGVYLYGEMVLSGCPTQRELAEDCFSKMGPDMEPGTRKLVHMLLFGKDTSDEEDTVPNDK